MTPADWPAVEAIYRAGIATGHATFEPQPPPDWEAFAAGKRHDLMIVAVDADDSVLGWAAAGPVSARPVYRGVVEHSVYVDPLAAGRGVGAQLLGDFLALTDRSGVWTVQSSVFPENAASLKLHWRAGFRVVGRRERIGLMPCGPLAGQWRDTVLIERRTLPVID
ncbi:GNAT family N-acetyltransferase [Enemella evansiae]|uniref:N-acetyltransferase n=1 Tax=Enemella evansiae TaxID=2016499 RepID=A0A255GSX1_9ACTN|nr:GNAT family N-acetyltransferase [Enemella evansiae]OYO14028.1 N-acetyltransferase [Enemella evansiae]OYO17533.1 N-acetyltransferase [Enemella evansiae]